MRAFRDDIEQSFIPRYGAVAKIILINVLAYVLLGAVGVILAIVSSNSPGEGQESFTRFLVDYVMLSPNFLEALSRPWTFFTYSIVHPYPGSIFNVLHIVFNMMWLFGIGRILREYVGDRTVWGIYLYGVFAGAVFFEILMNLMSGMPMLSSFGLMEASAGVGAVVVATATLLPNYRIGLMFIGLIQLKWLALIFVVLNFLMLMSHNIGGSISHLGGAFIGYLYIQQRREGRDLAQPFLWLAGKIRGIFKPKPAAKPRNLTRSAVQNKRVEVRNASRQPSYPAPSAETSAPDTGDKPTQEEIDRILERIKEVGYDRLTKAEKQALYRYSQDQ